ncbi:S-layer homology domain-containing protein [Paenibacillus abyssi]|uniref:SLH domain-containing protein n=1 Tax=Paenibacillus abyssi TaxID=1340531 RepID=A0A917CXJ5_9BACL|nr:S-layer homology domain-containing protein [Paenibacillus abyssi]GGF98959.1 hypothetical protein GCM10010916_15300 [Paenibacillus abyssi]
MKKATWKKLAISSLAVMTLMGGATSAFADGKEKGRDKDRKKGKEKHHQKAEIKINVNFKDLDEKEMEWAMEHIIRLASKGVFNGYEDGTFKPRQTISRIEALVAAVRLMGLREQAESAEEMSTDLNFKDAELLQEKYPWAVGYVAVALENDLFFETDAKIEPNKPADRLWATTLLVKALKLEDEAKAKNNTKLEFKDARQIPAGSVGYVAVAIEKGLVTGYQNNTFRPNQPVSRAELAALLDRTDNQLPDHDAQAVVGKLKADPASGAIILQKSDNTDVALALDPNVFIFRDGTKAQVSALKAGDEVLVRTFQNKVVFIEVTKSAAVNVAFTEIGKINSVTLNAQGKLSTISIIKTVDGNEQAVIFNVDTNVEIKGNASLLSQGQLIEVKGENGIVKSIEIK